MLAWILADSPHRDNSAQVVDDIDDLQKDLTPELTQLDAMLVDCLETLESLVTRGGGLGYHDDSKSEGDHSHAPLLNKIITSLEDSTLQPSVSKSPVLHVTPRCNGRLEPENIIISTHETIERNEVPPRSAQRSRNPKSPKPPREDNKERIRESLPSPDPLASPPAYPPPAKALPPIPPRKSSMRPVSRVSTPPSSPSSPVSTRPSIPPRSRERAFSDSRRDSKFSTMTSGTRRLSASSQASSTHLPPRSSSYHHSGSHLSLIPDTVSEEVSPGLDVVSSRRLEHSDKETSHGGVYCIDTSPTSTCLASRHGKFHVKLWDLPSGPMFTMIKVPFYVQVQPRSRDFFIQSHAILSEMLNLIAIATGFGQTLEIWNWAKRKKVQSISNAMRWTAVRAELQDEGHPSPLATYREDDDTISLYPATPSSSSTSSSKKPFGKPRVIELRRAGLPHLPKLPELAYSATSPLLMAAAGPRPPRPGAPPPIHAALLMVWQLDAASAVQTHEPYKTLQTTADANPELENCLPLRLATYGSVAVSIWEPAKFRTIGGPGLWQVEPVKVTHRVVLVWDFSVDKVTTYKIPHALSCVSPDCRFVAYCDPGSAGGEAGALVVLDATQGGRELWRVDGEGAAENDGESALGAKAGSRRSRRSHETRRSGRSSVRSDESSTSRRRGELGSLAGSLHKITDLAFSGDGKSLFVGDMDGHIGVYELREGSGIGIAV